MRTDSTQKKSEGGKGMPQMGGMPPMGKPGMPPGMPGMPPMGLDMQQAVHLLYVVHVSERPKNKSAGA